MHARIRAMGVFHGSQLDVRVALCRLLQCFKESAKLLVSINYKYGRIAVPYRSERW
jgi:hypothetical protein